MLGADLQSLLAGQGNDVEDYQRAASALGAVLRDPERGGAGRHRSPAQPKDVSDEGQGATFAFTIPIEEMR